MRSGNCLKFLTIKGYLVLLQNYFNMATYLKPIQTVFGDASFSTIGSAWVADETTLTLEATGNFRVFLRFPINIPAGSVINSAFIKVAQRDTNSTAMSINIVLLDTANINSFEASQNDLTVFSGSLVTWVCPSFTDGGGYVPSENIGSIVEKFINRSDYVPGNNMGIRMVRTSGAGTRIFSSFEGGAPAILEVNYTPGLQSPTFTSRSGRGSNKKTSIIELDNKGYFSLSKFVFTDGDGSSFSIKTKNSGIIGPKPPNVGDVGLGYLEIDLPSRKYQVKILNENGELLGRTEIDQRPKGTYGRKTARSDAGGVNLVDTVETKTSFGSRVESPARISVTKTSKGETIISNLTPVTKTNKGATIINNDS